MSIFFTNTLKRLAVFMAGMLTALSLHAAEHLFLVQTANYEKDLNYAIEKEWLEELEKASNGRLKFELVENGGVVDYHETLDAIKLGLLDGHMTTVGYFNKKDPAFGLFGNTIGAWSDTTVFLKYMYEGGGNEVMEKLYAPYGIQVIGGYTSGLEAFVSKVPIDSVSDLKGVTLRSPDALVTRVFRAAGAVPIELPGGQILDAMKKGTIVAADYSVFATNQAQGMNKVANHPVYPGFHSMPAFDFSVSKKKWDALPSDLQALLKRSVKEFATKVTEYLKKQDSKAVAEARKDPAIIIHNWSDEERRKFRLIAQQEWQKVAAESPLSQVVYDSITSFLNSK